MCISAYVPHFKTIERFSITFQSANRNREFVPPALYSCEKVISFTLFSSIRIVLDCSYQLIFKFEKILNLSLPFATTVTLDLSNAFLVSEERGIVWNSFATLSNGMKLQNMHN